LLNYLPSSTSANWALEIPELVPRNIDLERVCTLGKTAYQYDCQVNLASLDWEFALAVFTLNRHPMAGLLRSAGVKLLRQRWDGILLIVTAMLPIVAVVLVVWNVDRALFRPVGIASGCVAAMVLMFLVSRRIEKQRLEEDIERCRLGSRFVGS
jgi:undecaprenyl pyrophosphate phosphatase UppP